MNNNLLGKLQRVGKSLMLPIAVMPVVAILLRIGAMGQGTFFTVLLKAGEAVFLNLPILFAVGVAIGMAKQNHGAAGLAGVISYLTTTSIAVALDSTIEIKKMGILAGMISGLLAGYLYNKYHDIQLPDYLGFFSGKRFVPIVTSLASIVIGVIYGYAWPPVQVAIDALSAWTIGAGSVGYFTYGFINRLLIPTGLHHIINSFLWLVFGEFNGATGDIGRFFAGDPAAGIFMTGFFPVMMFGLPAAALAMYRTAKKENKSYVGGALFSVAFTAFLTGVTEPLEFMFMFLAPGLYVIHAILTGISLVITNALGMHLGFGFSAGVIDYLINWHLATKPILLIPVGLAFGAVYYSIFVFFIKKFDIKTPGREDLVVGGRLNNAKNDELAIIAKEFIQALGGATNLVEVDSCITRLRLTVENQESIDEAKLKELGSSGVVKMGKNGLQVIVGTKAEVLATRIKETMVKA